MPRLKNFWKRVDNMYHALNYARRGGSSLGEEIEKSGEMYMNESYMHEFKSMSSMFEDIFNDDEDWDKVRDAINDRQKRMFFRDIVTRATAATVGAIATPFKYMARASAGLALLATTRIVTQMGERVTEESIHRIYNQNAQQLEEIENKIKGDFRRDQHNAVVNALEDEIPNRDDKINFKKEAPSILLFLLLSGFVYYIEKDNMGSGMKKRKKQTRKSKRKGQRKSKRKGQRKSKKKGRRKSKKKGRRPRRRTKK